MESKKTIILMGGSGCGKSSVGRALASRLGWYFYDGDDYHLQGNIDKMAAGIPLEDADRWPWLEKLRDLITEQNKLGNCLVMACSALKTSYREVLRTGNAGLVYVHLDGRFDVILERMQEREGHYMKAEMLCSQFDVLERPQNGVRIDIEQSVEQIVEEIIGSLDLE